MNRSSRKCCTYSYRGNEETFLDLSCKKSPLTTTKMDKMRGKWEILLVLRQDKLRLYLNLPPLLG